MLSGHAAGQEDQLGAHGLVLNAVVLFNTRHIDLAVTALRAQGYRARDEDATRLSPLGYAHINMLGRYTFPRPVKRTAVQVPARPGCRCRLMS